MNKDAQFTNLIDSTPKLLISLLFLLLTLPALSAIIGFDLGHSSYLYKTDYFFVFIYRWSISIISLLIILFAMIDYWVNKNDVIFIVGLTFLFTAVFNTLFSLSNQWIFEHQIRLGSLHAYIWFISNTLMGLSLIFGLTLYCFQLKQALRFFLQSILVFALIASTTYWLHLLTNGDYQLLGIIHPHALLENPLALLNFIVYVYLLCLYTKIRRIDSSLLTRIFFYLAIIQIVMSLYVMFGFMKSYDAAYFGSSFLQLLCYLMILCTFMIRYVHSYISLIKFQKQIRDEKEHFELLSHQDSLTNLPNRRAFETELERQIASADRNQKQFALLFLDLDDFKDVNDQAGHETGDALLKQVAGRLLHSLRTNDYCARLGGDEFAIIISDVISSTQTSTIIEKITSILQRPYTIADTEIRSKISIGLAIYPTEAKNSKELLQRADTAMYLDKNAKKKRD